MTPLTIALAEDSELITVEVFNATYCEVTPSSGGGSSTKTALGQDITSCVGNLSLKKGLSSGITISVGNYNWVALATDSSAAQLLIISQRDLQPPCSDSNTDYTTIEGDEQSYVVVTKAGTKQNHVMQYEKIDPFSCALKK